MTTLAVLSTIFISILGYAILGFATASLNHLIFEPDYDNRTPAFIISFVGWPVILIIDIIAGIVKFLVSRASLLAYFDYLDGLEERRRQKKMVKRQHKDIRA